MQKEQFLKAAKVIRSTLLTAAAENFTYKWNQNGETEAAKFKQNNLVTGVAIAHCLMIRELLPEKSKAPFQEKLERAHFLERYNKLIEENQDLGLTMPIGSSDRETVRNLKDLTAFFQSDVELNETELRDLGFTLWEDKRSENGRRLWVIPLWLVPFLKCGQQVETIDGSVNPFTPDLDRDHRGGCVAFGFRLLA